MEAKIKKDMKNSILEEIGVDKQEVSAVASNDRVMCGAGCSHDEDDEYSDAFFYERIEKECCPKCGCTKVTSVGNTADYPDNWTKWNCLNCNHLIAEIDNSPMHTCWEFEDCTIDL